MDSRAVDEIPASPVAIEPGIVDELWRDSDWGWSDDAVERSA
jgi:hypothetical protein